jgi:Ras-related protein Rab-32
VIQRYTMGAFSSNYRNTIGVDFAMKLVNWAGSRVRLQLWDVAGQERFGTLTHVYYKETSAAMIVFDADKFRTFDSVLRVRFPPPAHRSVP